MFGPKIKEQIIGIFNCKKLMHLGQKINKRACTVSCCSLRCTKWTNIAILLVKKIKLQVRNLIFIDNFSIQCI